MTSRRFSFSSVNKNPNGYIFFEDGKYKRQISLPFERTFRYAYENILKDPEFNEDILPIQKITKEIGIIIEPSNLDFCYLTHEMPFSLLKKVSLFHLKLSNKLLEKDFIIKSPQPDKYQLLDGKTILADHSSLIPYDNQPEFIFYKDFIELFIGPMALLSSEFKNLLPFYEKVSIEDIKRIAPSLLKNFNISFFRNIMIRSNHYNQLRSRANLDSTKTSIFRLLKGLTKLTHSIYLPLANPPPKQSLQYEDDLHRQQYQDKKITKINQFLENYQYQRILSIGNHLNTNLGINNTKATVLHVEEGPQISSQLYSLLKKENKSQQFVINIPPLDIFKRTGDFQSTPSVVTRFRPNCVVLISMLHRLHDDTSLSVDSIIKRFKSLNADLFIEYITIETLTHFSNHSTPRYIYPTREEFIVILEKYYGSVRSLGTMSAERELFLAQTRTI